MNKLISLSGCFSVYILKYISAVFFYIPVAFFWLCVLFYFNGHAELFSAELLTEIVVITCIITPLAVWFADVMAFTAKHRKQPSLFSDYSAEAAALLVIIVVVLIGFQFIPSDVFPLTESLLR